MIRIDPRVEKILSLSFIQDELLRHSNLQLSEIGINNLLMERRNSWAAYIPADKKILFDSTVQPSVLRESYNRKWPEFCLQEGEAWACAFYHELKHALGECSEDECNRYAMQRILELRKKKENEYKSFVSAISKLVRQGIRASFDND